MAADGVDQAGILQGAQDIRDAGAADSEHQGQKFVRERELIGLAAVAGRQEPAAAALLHGVQAIAGGALHGLSEEGGFVTEDEHSQIDESVRGFDKSRRVDPLGSAIDLRVAPAGNSIRAHQQDAADYSFAPDRADFDAAAVFHDGDDRNHAAFGKIGVADGLMWLVEGLRHFKLNRLQRALQEFELVCGEFGEKNIARRTAPEKALPLSPTTF